MYKQIARNIQNQQSAWEKPLGDNENKNIQFSEGFFKKESNFVPLCTTRH